MSDDDTLRGKARRWLYAGLMLTFLFAITWGLPSSLNLLFFLLAAYCFFLSWYYSPRTHRGSTSGWRSPEEGVYQESNPMEKYAARVRQIVIIVAVSAFGLFFLLFLIGVFVSDKEETTTVSIAEDSESRKAVKTDPENIDALTTLGNEFYGAGQYDSANYYYDLVLRRDGRNTAALYNKGLILYNQQKPDESFPFFTRAYDGGMREAFLCHVLGYLHDNNENSSMAIRFYKEALEMDSTRVEIYTRLAELEPGSAARYKALEVKWKN